MRISHIYQPAMVTALLKNGGQASVRTIARALLAYDTSQIEYYEHITKTMVGRVLAHRKIVLRDEGGSFPAISRASVYDLARRDSGAGRCVNSALACLTWREVRASFQ